MPRPIFIAALWIKSNEKAFRVMGVTFFLLAILVGIIWIAGRDVEPVAFVLGCTSSSMFGMIEVAKYLVPDRKAVRDMAIDEILSLVKASNSAADWKVIDTEVVSEAVLKEDPRLRATIRYDERGIQNEDFREPWANCFADPTARGYWVEVSYDRGLIDRRVLVSVDGGRAILPMPASRTEPVVDGLSYRLAQLFDSRGTLDEYARRAGLKCGP